MIDLATLLNVVGVATFSSISHCAFMCGGFVLIYNAKLADKSAVKSLFFNLIYHFGRVFSYAILGVLFGLFGSIVIFSAKSKGITLFLVGIFLVILGISLLKRGKLLEILENDKIYKILLSKFRHFSQKSGIFSFFIFGVLNGFLPCGVVYYFLALSISEASVFRGATIMLIFGLCTIPSMMILGGIIHRLNANFRHLANNITAVFIAIYGIFLSYKGFMVLR